MHLCNRGRSHSDRRSGSHDARDVVYKPHGCTADTCSILRKCFNHELHTYCCGDCCAVFVGELHRECVCCVIVSSEYRDIIVLFCSLCMCLVSCCSSGSGWRIAGWTFGRRRRWWWRIIGRTFVDRNARVFHE